MSSSSSDENDTTIHRSAIYSQQKAGSSKRSSTRHDVSDAEEDEERFREESVIEVDDAITVLLSSLHFEQKRTIVPTDAEDNELRELHEKIFRIITNEPDDLRRRRLKKALPASNCIREQVFYLRRKPTNPPGSYYHRLNAALHAIVKESFGEDYRKVATVLGLVDALAEVLILELQAFGIPEDRTGEHRNIRKLIANALTNLTYGQIHSKRRLCAYDGFVRCVVRIIIDSPNITQVYAGLIRNLSWNVDSIMSEALQPTVHALAIAAVFGHNNGLDVTATLQALWNLAGHSVENRRTICDTPNCLKVLANLLSSDARRADLVDSATGILKYVSQYLANTSTHLELRPLLITRMLTLLKSASFTCVTNTLGAIANLITKDPHMQQMIRQDQAAVHQLNVLRNSTHDDIRAAVKSVLNTLNQPHQRFGDMSHSVGLEPLQMQTSHHQGYHGTASPRLLSLRATRASPGKYIQQPPQIQIPQQADQRSCSLPRHFQRNAYMQGMMAQSYNPEQQQIMFQMHQQQIFQASNDQMYLQQQHQQQQFQPQIQEEPPQAQLDLDIPTSTVMGTRSNSERSLGSMNPGSVMTTGGWNSTLDTAANSSRALSPVSFSDIPASPTMCSQVFGLQNANPQNSEAPNTTHYSSGSANTMTRSDATVPIDNLITPTYAILNPQEAQQAAHPPKNSEELESPDDVLPGPSFEEGDYAIIGEKNDDLLNRSIQAEMPTSSSTPQGKLKISPRLNGFFSPIQKSPSSRNKNKSQHQNSSTSEADRLLMESIMAEMPKNEQADRREPSDRDGVLREGSDSFDTATNHTMCIGEYSDDDDVDASIPHDCVDDDDYDYTEFDDDFEDEEDPDATQFDEGINPHLTIDCSTISSGSSVPRATSTPIGSTSSIPKKSRLPVPKTNGSLVKPAAANNRPRLPPKPKQLTQRHYPEDELENQTSQHDETIYVNAPTIAEEQERIYMNALRQKEETTAPTTTTKSAVVSPYNYQKSSFMPDMKKEKSPVQSNPKQMLVTIV